MTTKLTDNKMMTLLGKTVILALIPKAVDSVYMYFTSSITVPTPTVKKFRKKMDNTPLTQEHFDYIQEQYKQYTEFNMLPDNLCRLTLADFAFKLNTELGLDKTSSVYGTIFHNKVKKENLLKTNKPILVGRVIAYPELAIRRYGSK